VNVSVDFQGFGKESLGAQRLSELLFSLYPKGVKSPEMSTYFGLGQLPAIDDTDEVQFYYLESSFPFNAPDSVVSKAGSQFTSFVTTHCGLGIFDVTKSLRFSVELVALNYTGALLPVATSTSFAWNNEASIAVTNPFDPTRWLVSRLVSTTSGTAYSDLVDWLVSGSWNPGQIYNPVTVALVGSGAKDTTVAPTDSYTFVQQVLQQLSNFGAPLDSFLSPSATAFTYYTTRSPTVLSWRSQDPAPASVRLYYKALNDCYSQALADSTNPWLSLQSKCYIAGSHALVFRSTTSVWNVSIAASPATPALVRAPYALPVTPSQPIQKMSATDTIFIVVLLVAGLCGLAGILKQTVCVRKSRFELEQEKMAEETVGGILRGEDGIDYPHYSQTDRDLREYFYPTRFSWERWYPWNWSFKLRRGAAASASSSGFGSGSGSGSSSRQQGSTSGVGPRNPWADDDFSYAPLGSNGEGGARAVAKPAANVVVV